MRIDPEEVGADDGSPDEEAKGLGPFFVVKFGVFAFGEVVDGFLAQGAGEVVVVLAAAGVEPV